MSHTNTFSPFFTAAMSLLRIALFNPQIFGQGNNLSPSYQNTGQISLFGQQCPHGRQRDKCSICTKTTEIFQKSFDGGTNMGRSVRQSVPLPKGKVTARGKAGAVIAFVTAVSIINWDHCTDVGIAAAIVAVLFFLGIIYGFGTEDAEETVAANEPSTDDPPSDSPLIGGLPLEFGDEIRGK